MRRVIKKFAGVAGLLLAALFSQNAAAVINNYYFSTGAAAQSACYAAHGSVSCAATNNSSGYKYWWDPGWGTTDNYWYTTTPGINQCVGKPYTRLGQCRDTAFTPVQCTNVGLVSDGAGNCVTAPPACSPPKDIIAGVCTTPPSCGNLGQTWDFDADACAWPDTPPTCGAGEIATVNGSGATVACTAATDIDESCDYSKGYDASGYFICSDEAAGCEAKGGTAGYIDGSAVCIPADYSPPVCDSTQAVMLDAGGFVCSTPADVKPPAAGEVPNPSANPAPPAESTTNTSGQSAAPGTGTTGGGSGGTGTPEAPAVEAHEGTPEAGKTGQARSSGNCAAPPVCSGGDPQMCALLRQQWETMCKGNDMIEEADDNQRSVFEQNVADAIDRFSVDGTVGDAIDDGLNVGSNGPLNNAQIGTWQGFVSSLIPGGGSCATLTMELPAAAGGQDLVITCDGTAKVRSWLGWAFYVMTALYIFSVVFTPTRS